MVSNLLFFVSEGNIITDNTFERTRSSWTLLIFKRIEWNKRRIIWLTLAVTNIITDDVISLGLYNWTLTLHRIFYVSVFFFPPILSTKLSPKWVEYHFDTSYYYLVSLKLFTKNKALETFAFEVISKNPVIAYSDTAVTAVQMHMKKYLVS